MSLQKNVASQKIVWLMVDATDFATPETGITVTAKYSKDGGGLSTCSNTVSEVTSGLYVVTLAQTETNADVVAYQMTGTGCADQWLIMYPEDGYAARISDIDSILADATIGLDAIETIVSDIKSTIDGPIDSAITQNTGIVSDILSTIDSAIHSTLDAIHSTLDGPIDSAITQNTGLISDVLSTIDGPVTSDLSSIEADTAAILTDTGTTLDNKIDSILADTGTTLDNKIDSILADTGTTLENRTTSIVDLVSDILSTLDGPIHSTIDKVDSTIDGPLDSAVTQNTGLISDILSTIDGPVISDLSNIESTVATLGGDSDKITSILADTKEINSQCDSILADTGTTLNALVSDILSTLDGPVESALSDIQSSISNIAGGNDTSGVTSILGYLKDGTNGLSAIETNLSDIISTLDGPVESALSDLQSAVGNLASGDSSGVTSLLTYLKDGTNGLSAIETLLSDIQSSIDSAVISTLDAIHSTIDGPIDSALTQNTGLISDILSTIDGPVISDLSNIESTVAVLGGDSNNITSILADTKEINSQCDSILAKATSILTDTGTTLDNKVDSILADTGTTLNGLVSDVLSTLDGPIDSAITQNTSLSSDILSTIDGPVISDLAAIETDTGTTLDNKIDSILVDTGTTLDDKIDSILVDTGTTIQAQNSDILSTLDGPITTAVKNPIKKNTALSNFEFFMIDSSDEVSGKTGLTITAERSIDGGAFASCANSASEVGNGIYKINLAAADLNGDTVTLKFTSAGALATILTIVTDS